MPIETAATARAYETAEFASDVEVMTRLHHLSTRLIQAGELNALLGEIIETALSITGASKGNIQLFHDGALRIIEQRGFDAAFLDYFNNVERGKAACGTAVERGERVIVENVETSPIFAGTESCEVLLAAGVRAVQSTPLVSRSGRLLGMFSTHHSVPQWPSERDLRLLDVLGRQSADLMERTLNEQALRASEQRFRSLIGQSVAGIAECSPDGRFISVNDHFCKALGYTREELLTMHKQDITHPEDHARNTGLFQRCVENAEAFEIEKRYVRKNGSTVWVHNSVSPVLDDAGGLRSIVMISIDISDRKAMEASLERSRRTFFELVERAPFGIYIIDSQFRIAQMNRGSQNGAFRNVRPVIGHDFANAMRILWPEQVAAEIIGAFRHTLETGEPYYSDRFMNPRHDVDALEAYEWELHRMTLPDGQAGVICYYFDSTKLRSTEAALRSANEQLLRANRDLEQFSYSASHDLREPLRSIRIYGEFLKKKCKERLDREALEWLDLMTRGAAHMDSLLRDLLTYTQASRFETPRESVDAGQCLKAALENLAGAIAETGAEIRADMLPAVNVHASQLEQLFQNIIGNAIKYRKQAVPPIVRLSAEQQDGYWRFAIKDNGIGIEEQYKERVFGLFKRLHTQHEYTGTGIGLALCARIVEQHHGRIWVESEPGTGSTFFFTLPGA